MTFNGPCVARIRLGAFALLAFATLFGAKTAAAQTCTYNVGDDTIAYGQMFATTQPGERALGKRTTTLTVVCDAPTDMSMQYVDDAPDAQAPSWRLDSVGRFNVQLSNVVVDDVPVQLSGSGGAQPATVNTLQALAPNRDVVPFRDGSPVVGTRMTAQLDVDAWLSPGVVVTNEQTWTGHGRLRFAATGEDVPFEVQAALAPGSCNLSLSGGGNVNLGDIQVASLPFTTPTSVAPQNVTLNINCTAAGLFAVGVTDNRASTAWLPNSPEPGQDVRSFGLGRTRSNTPSPIGNFEVVVTSATAGGSASTPIVGSNVAGWTAPTPAYFETTVERYNAAGTAAGGPAVASTGSWTLQVRPTIAPRRDLRPSGNDPIDGSITITLFYP